MPVIVPRPDHPISRADISDNALKVLYRLKGAGFGAFLVGGSVRDLLLQRKPKDFDVATDAHPDQVRELFRNCRLIGRRFRLAHVRFGREIIEVATFRAAHDPDHEDHVRDDHGRILRDNVYGSIEEDVWRRDFTANSLYYNIADFSIWDYTGGFEDINNRCMRLIGDPDSRYREDPVRMLRAIRFCAKLDFTMHPDTAKPVKELASLLPSVPAARLFEEIIKLFHGGGARSSFDWLREYGLFGYLFRQTEDVVSASDGEQDLRLIRLALENTDQRIAEGKPVTPLFVFAVMLWGPIRRRASELADEGMKPFQALTVAADEVTVKQQATVSLPRRFAVPMREVLVLQPRFQQRRGRRAALLLENRRFRAAYDFFCLRAAVGEADQELADWWTELQTLPPEEWRRVLGLRKARRRPRMPRRPREGGEAAV